MLKKFFSRQAFDVQELPYELIRHIILMSDNPNCLLVSHGVSEIWSERLRERNTKKGLLHLQQGSFFGLVLAKHAQRMHSVADAAASGNKRLLKKLLCINEKQCYAFCQENALYGATFAGDKKLSIWIHKKFRANSVSGFHGALDGGHEALCKFWWNKLKKKINTTHEKRIALSSAMIRCASSGGHLLDFLVKLGGIPTPGAFEECARKGNLGSFRYLLQYVREEDKDAVLSSAIRTKKPLFVYACFAFGLEAKNVHIQEASKLQGVIKLIITPITVA
ncbi:hypothetical protein [Brazilian marseillevirus]|uniref:hypothetical protein n=1 Tax=Brazilian marseillevirus TaxID=1813599 RepID=UPI000784495A|nr:hypothetical protein A3303_gp195 [Brazilian marseillevirus]AMQ10703.1 hypothetical protein [Brazilian marseillevirus]